MIALNRGFALNPPRSLYYFIFTVSGFSGLIYESIWSHYLKLFLGHAAYAQSLVLSIFMGGMAVGAWLAGRYSVRWRSPILIYAFVEAVIGILALIFHGSFVGITDAVYTSLLPGMDSPALAHGLKWTIAALMIVPQSILLGMTFPLMTAGVLRRYPRNPGGSIALLYFTNSIGAATGVLASGFWLIEAVGLPGTIITAGSINILLALVVGGLVKLDTSAATAPLSSSSTGINNRANRLMLGAAFITGMASFIYEIGWIRMLSLVLGSSTHAFELMLSAFITGLAFGGLFIRKWIDRIASPLKFAAWVQIAMGLLALLTLPMYGFTFDWMQTLLQTVSRTDSGYTAFLLASHSIVLIIMLPATFCAGMTLPLFTHALLKSGYGEKSIGGIYAFNTLGSIVGVLFAVNIGMPYFGLKYLIGFGALLDVALGVVLLYFVMAAGMQRIRRLSAYAAVIAVVSVFIISLANLSPSKLASGVFRYQRTELPADQKIYYYRDGKTASIALHGDKNGLLTITTNGKPDAGIMYGESRTDHWDEDTMIMLGSLVFGFKTDAKTVAVIGMGSGMTTHTALALPDLERVDTVEIESAIVEAARHFGHRVARAYDDPRSHIHIEDAKTFFAVNNRSYDVIISEPSNPWVSGVSSLYTREFYSQISNYLNDDGLLVQWIHLYENDIRLLVSILKAMDGSFDDYALYFTNSLDIMIIARKSGELGKLDAEFVFNSELQQDLEYTHLQTPSDMYHRLILTKKHLSGILRQYDSPANSDYYPYLDLHAFQAFFAGFTITEFNIDKFDFPYADILNSRHQGIIPKSLGENERFFPATTNRSAEAVYQLLMHNNPEHFNSTLIELRNAVHSMQASASRCNREVESRQFLENLHKLGRYLIANLDADKAARVLNSGLFATCFANAAPDLQLWLGFYRLVAARDYPGMVQASRMLLNGNYYEDREDLQAYLLSAAIIGSYMEGNYRRVIDIWEQLPEILPYPELLPFYLRAVVFSVYQPAE